LSSNEANKKIALKMIEQITRGVIDETLVAPDAYWWIPGRGKISRAEFQQLIDSFGKLRRSEGRMVVHGITAENDRVAVEAESFVELINGSTYNNTYHFLFEFDGGKIRCSKEYNDSKYANDILGAFAER
jgi:ketosteroid isomerase-like protein